MMAAVSPSQIFLRDLLPHAFICSHKQITRTMNFRARGTRRHLKSFHQSFRRSFMAVQMENGQHSTSRGSLIVFEGLDRSGKTSQCGKLLSYLKGKGLSVEAWRFPDRSTGVGQMISSYLANQSNLDNRAIHLLFSANRWEKRALMENKLQSGITLIVDRYSYSGAPEAGLIAPDLVIYLDVPPEKALKGEVTALSGTSNLSSKKGLQSHYKTLHDDSWEVIDGCLSMEAVQQQLRELATNCVKTCQRGKPLVSLWSTK
ncbi:Thymidylate kinase [Ananas comosus]|uniref:Thymidylate kinase n=1 Tax=Ananas comosus TaxID=4615 RepID=A0A199V729_ANACO|nr:Thymidylate kinase [Ananas comosus]